MRSKHTPNAPRAQQPYEPTGVIVHGDARPGSRSFHSRNGYAMVPAFWTTTALAQHLKKYATTLQLARLVSREPNGGNIITETMFNGVEPSVEVAHQLAKAASEGSWPR